MPANKAGTDGAPAPEGQAARLGDVAMQVGTIIRNNMGKLWFSNADMHTAVASCFTAVHGALENAPELFFRRVGDCLDIADVDIPLNSRELQVLADQFDSLNISGLVIARGLQKQEFSDLLEILSARAEELNALGGFEAFMRRVGIEHVAPRQVILKEVTDGDMVVKKQDAPPPLSDEARAQRRDEALTYLRHDGSDTSADTVRDALTAVRDDTGAMADLIVESARVPGLDEGDAVSASRVRDALQRAFDVWAGGPEMKTQKAKKALARSMRALKGAVLERLGGLPGFNEETESLLQDAFESFDDELKMDALAAEYLRKRKAISDSEARILRYIRKKGRSGVSESDLEERLLAGGLEGGEWRDLLTRSGVAGSLDDEGSGGAVRELTSRLASIEDALRKKDSGSAGGTDAGKLAGELKNVAVDVDAMVTDTNRKIADMVEGYQGSGDTESAEGDGTDDQGAGSRERKRRMTKQELYETLSEISQELCQPLSVINCSISMIQSGRLGTIGDGQGDMLNLATQSTQKLKDIADSLMDITGVPLDLEPDADIQSEIYRHDDA